MTARVLVAGIGNVFFGDDAFGVEVARRLAARTWPEGVVVRDFGIRGHDLAYALMDGPALAILVDAMPHGAAPGTLRVIEPAVDVGLARVATHGMDPASVLRMVEAGGVALPPLRVVGCEPTPWTADAMSMGLSPAVEAAVEPACAIVATLVEEALGASRGGEVREARSAGAELGTQSAGAASEVRARAGGTPRDA